MITKYIVIVQTGEHNYKPYGSFKTLEDAECFQNIMGGSIEEIECFEKGGTIMTIDERIAALEERVKQLEDDLNLHRYHEGE